MENENVFFRVDENGNEIAVTTEEIEQAVEELETKLDEDEFLPPPPEEIFFNWDSLK